MRNMIFCLIGTLSAPYARAGEPPPGFARLADVAPDIRQEMRYAGADNFTGAPVNWSRDADARTNAEHCPNLAKGALFPEGYIAEHSTHSTGLAVDIGVSRWDFGTPFDFFDPSSWTKARTSKTARAHRDALLELMRRHGFQNYPREWWHFSYKGVDRAPSYDVEIK